MTTLHKPNLTAASLLLALAATVALAQTEPTKPAAKPSGKSLPSPTTISPSSTPAQSKNKNQKSKIPSPPCPSAKRS